MRIDTPSPGCRSTRILEEGRRVILFPHIPGDLSDLQSLHRPNTDFGVASLSSAAVAFARPAELRRLKETSQALADAR